LLYLDTSAAVKLLLEEAESAALVAYLGTSRGPLVTSRIGIVELRRVGRRGGASPDRADALAASFAVVEVDQTVEGIAAGLDSSLRSLDAIHLASALALQDQLDVFACYDRQLGAAAEGLGMRVAAPAP
jgi:predicted nucleic acid-binding protein